MSVLQGLIKATLGGSINRKVRGAIDQLTSPEQVLLLLLLLCDAVSACVCTCVCTCLFVFSSMSCLTPNKRFCLVIFFLLSFFLSFLLSFILSVLFWTTPDRSVGG